MKIEINNRSFDVQEGESVLAAVERYGVKIPTLCFLEGLFPSGACRMCVVEIEGNNNLVPSCAVTVQDGMKVKTHSPKVLRARKTILELLLADHPDDCLYCEKTGDCELQDLAQEFGIRQRAYPVEKRDHEIDNSSVSLVHDPAKCILCGRCVRICEEIQGVSAIDFTGRGSDANVGTAFKQGLNMSNCISCGQCVRGCPTGALNEKNSLKEVLAAIADPEKMVVIQHAPAVSVTLGEYFGLKPGTDVDGVLNAGLRRAGFEKVFDTSFSADLTIMEEALELVERVKTGGPLPMFTSCSPGWVKYVEQTYPEMLKNISTCKSPQQMLGALVKNYYAEKVGMDPSKIYSVSVMPCTAKKYEANRGEMTSHGLPDIDVAITTRELSKLFKVLNIDLNRLSPEETDNPLGERTTAGKMFGASGGVMEAAVRTANYLITGKDADHVIELKDVRGFEGVKEASLPITEDLTVNIAVINGLGNVDKVMEDIKMGKKNYHFIEVMTCPGGCINGGGQPHGIEKDKVVARMKALYNLDNAEGAVRLSHKNKSVQALYDNYLGKPLGEVSHHLLHTKYTDRKNAGK